MGPFGRFRGALRRAALAACLLGVAGFSAASTPNPRIAEYAKAGIDWQQVSGETIDVMVIPANFFQVLQELTPIFTELTGIKVNYQFVPPVQLREKHVLDLSTRAGQFATAATDPQYYPLYATNGWVEDLARYLNDPKLTNQKWFNLQDIFPVWLESTSHAGKLYGVPYDGEATIPIYRRDLYDAKGMKAPQTLEELMQAAKALHQPDKDFYGISLCYCIRLINMYIWPSIFRAYGGEWFDKEGRPTVNSKAGVAAAEYYIALLDNYGPKGAAQWNWPESLDAFVNDRLGHVIMGSSVVAVMTNPAKSKVVDKLGFARWPKGPTGKRVTSVWNWSFPINAAISERKKKATWLFIQWATSQPTQVLGSYAYTGKGDRRSGVNRMSMWASPEYRKSVEFGPDFAEVVLTSIREDTDVHWRPRVPQWPQIANVMGIQLHKALAKQATAKEAMDEANAKIAEIMKGR